MRSLRTDLETILKEEIERFKTTRQEMPPHIAAATLASLASCFREICEMDIAMRQASRRSRDT